MSMSMSNWYCCCCDCSTEWRMRLGDGFFPATAWFIDLYVKLSRGRVHVFVVCFIYWFWYSTQLSLQFLLFSLHFNTFSFFWVSSSFSLSSHFAASSKRVVRGRRRNLATAYGVLWWEIVTYLDTYKMHFVMPTHTLSNSNSNNNNHAGANI